MNKLFFYILPVFFIMICCKNEPDNGRPKQSIITPSIIVSEDETIYISYHNSKTRNLNFFRKYKENLNSNIIVNDYMSSSFVGLIGISIQNEIPIIYTDNGHVRDNPHLYFFNEVSNWNTEPLIYKFANGEPLIPALMKITDCRPLFISEEERIFAYNYNYADKGSDIELYLFNPDNENNLITLPPIPGSLIKTLYDGISESEDVYHKINPLYFNGEWDGKNFLICFFIGFAEPEILSIYHAIFSNSQWALNKITLPAKTDFNGSVSYLTKGGKIFTTIGRTMIINVSADGKAFIEKLEKPYSDIYQKLRQLKLSLFSDYDYGLFESQLFSDCIDNSGRVHAIVDENSDKFVYDIYYHVYDPASSTPLIPVERVFLERMEW